MMASQLLCSMSVAIAAKIHPFGYLFLPECMHNPKLSNFLRKDSSYIFKE